MALARLATVVALLSLLAPALVQGAEPSTSNYETKLDAVSPVGRRARRQDRGWRPLPRGQERHRQAGVGRRLRQRAVSALPPERPGRGQRKLSRPVPQRDPVRHARERDDPPQRAGDHQGEMGEGRRRRLIPVVRPSHPLDGERATTGCEGREQAHADLPVEGAGQGRRDPCDDRAARSRGCRPPPLRTRASPRARSPRSSPGRSCCSPRSRSSCAGAARRTTAPPLTRRRSRKPGETRAPGPAHGPAGARAGALGGIGARRAGEHRAPVGRDREAASPSRSSSASASPSRATSARSASSTGDGARVDAGEVFHPGGKGPSSSRHG